MPNVPRKMHELHPLRLLPLLLCVLMVILCLAAGGFSAEDILHYAPRDPWLAAGFILLLYFLKSLSVAFPIMVLQIAAGHLFSPAAALALNILGLAIDLTVPYWIGPIFRQRADLPPDCPLSPAGRAYGKSAGALSLPFLFSAGYLPAPR